MAGENGQATIRTIRDDGLERVAQLDDATLRFYQFLPLYDVIHLGNVMRQGYAPTSGELTWALIDGCFVVADVLSLSALQPEGAAAAAQIGHAGPVANARSNRAPALSPSGGFTPIAPTKTKRWKSRGASAAISAAIQPPKPSPTRLARSTPRSASSH